MPTAARNLSGLSVRHLREHYLVDCGEGTQRQLIRYGTGFDVSAICFTHLHADHYVGAIGFVRTLSMLGPNFVAASVPVHGRTGPGSFHRRSPAGGAANGIPL